MENYILGEELLIAAKGFYLQMRIGILPTRDILQMGEEILPAADMDDTVHTGVE